MAIKTAPCIQDLRVYEGKRVCKESGRKVLNDLEARGLINPQRTSTGRTYLTIDDALALEQAL